MGTSGQRTLNPLNKYDGTSRWRFVGAGDVPSSAKGDAEKWAVRLHDSPPKLKKKEAEDLVRQSIK